MNNLIRKAIFNLYAEQGKDFKKDVAITRAVIHLRKLLNKWNKLDKVQMENSIKYLEGQIRGMENLFGIKLVDFDG